MLKRYTIKIISLFVLFTLAPVALLVFISKSSKVDIVTNAYKAYADSPPSGPAESCYEGCCQGGGGGCQGAS